jgi:hypothetical protein
MKELNTFHLGLVDQVGVELLLVDELLLELSGLFV